MSNSNLSIAQPEGYTFLIEHLLPWEIVKRVIHANYFHCKNPSQPIVPINTGIIAENEKNNLKDIANHLHLTFNVVVSCGSFNPITTAHVQMLQLAKHFLNNSAKDVLCSAYCNIVTPEDKNTGNSVEAVNNPGADVRVTIGGFISPVSDAYKKNDLASFSQRQKCCEIALEDVLSHKWDDWSAPSPINAEHDDSELSRDYFEKRDWISIDNWEGLQPHYTRSYNVLQHINKCIMQHYSNCIDATEASDKREIYKDIFNRCLRIYFVCGGDLFETFYHKGVWDVGLLESIFRDFNLIVISRIGSGNPIEVMTDHASLTCQPNLPNLSVNLKKYSHKVHVLQIRPNEMSSTKVRDLVRQLLKNGKKDPEVVKACEKELDEMVTPSMKEYLLKQKMYE